MSRITVPLQTCRDKTQHRAVTVTRLCLQPGGPDRIGHEHRAPRHPGADSQRPPGPGADLAGSAPAALSPHSPGRVLQRSQRGAVLERPLPPVLPGAGADPASPAPRRGVLGRRVGPRFQPRPGALDPASAGRQAEAGRVDPERHLQRRGDQERASPDPDLSRTRAGNLHRGGRGRRPDQVARAAAEPGHPAAPGERRVRRVRPRRLVRGRHLPRADRQQEPPPRLRGRLHQPVHLARPDPLGSTRAPSTGRAASGHWRRRTRPAPTSSRSGTCICS